MTAMCKRGFLILLGVFFLLGGCQSGLHLPRPRFYASDAEIIADQSAVDVELVARNATQAPMWIRKVDLQLDAQSQQLAHGLWTGDRRIESGTSVLLAIRLGLTEGAILPEKETPGELAVVLRYARSGLIGLMGGESFSTTVPVVIRHAQGSAETDSSGETSSSEDTKKP